MKRFLKSVEGRVITVLLIILAVALLIGGLVSITQETKAGLLVFKPATVRNLVTEFATYSDGDGIEISGKPIATTLKVKAIFPELEDEYYGYTMYRLVDPDHPKFEIFLLSKRMLLGNETIRFRCELHKYARNSKFLVEVEQKPFRPVRLRG